MPCHLSCRSCYGVIPTEALCCGAKSSGCPLAPPGKHDEQWLFARSWRKHPDSHSKIIKSTFCTDGPQSVNSRCVSATAHQEEFRRISGDSDLEERSQADSCLQGGTRDCPRVAGSQCLRFPRRRAAVAEHGAVLGPTPSPP